MAGVDENEEVIYIIDGSDVDGKVKVGDDLKEEVIETLATYLHCLSRDEKNTFTISPGVQKRSHTTPTGDPAPLDENLNGSENAFAPTAQNSQLRSFSDSGKIFTPSIGSFLTKGKADTFLKDLEEGFTDTSGQTGVSQAEGPVFDAIRSALDNNRFSPGVNGAFINGGSAPTTVGRTQAEFGRHNKDGKDIKIEDLSKIGFSLMFRAAREIKAVQEGDPLEPPESFAVGLGALIPGATQIALLRADTNDLRASRVMEENFDLPQKPRTDTEPQINPNNKSWGHLNTPLEPYSGFLPIGMTALALVLTVAIRVLAFAFVGFLGLIVKEKLGKVPNRGPFITGEYGKPDPPGKLFSLNAIGIRDTERDFLTVVNEGLDLFFSFDGADFRRVVREPQFFAIFVRNIIRSGNIIVNSVADVFSSGQNPLAAAQAFLGLIDVLKSSKIVAFLNIMAQLGDRAAEAREQGFDPQDTKKSSLENLPHGNPGEPGFNPATNVMRIRNSRSDLRSGMRTGATLSMFLFPPEIMRAADVSANISDANKSLASLPGGQIAGKNDVDGNGRITAETVTYLESQLDSEYVPFYFHDLRTNEIISFHAFLDTLEDNYTPQYESATAYGRIDNVRTYIATERTITLSFKIVATSKDDFDFMWWKINKLTTLVYPSWTQGRQVAAGDSRFIQPFSQVPASTPVIRLRIGDLIRSNFSKMGLARLFGAGLKEDQFNLVNTSFPGDDELEKVKDTINVIRQRMVKNPAITGNAKSHGYYGGETAILLPKRTGYPVAPDPLAGVARVKALLGQEPRKKLIVTASTKVRIVGPIAFQGVSLGESANIEDYGEHRVAYYTIEVVDASSEMQGKYIVTHDDLMPDPEQISALAASQLQLPDTPSVPLSSIPSKPFDASENAIVRSFQTVQGKGLGGVITSLAFSDLAAPTISWETSEFGSRAPKMITCNMTFAVIHDIAPGIDEKGFNRGFQYPVGNATRHLMGDNIVSENNNAEANFNKNHEKASIGLRNDNAKAGTTKGFPGGL